MTPDPQALSDEELDASLDAARLARTHDGRLGARMELAALLAERDRRVCEWLWEAS